MAPPVGVETSVAASSLARARLLRKLGGSFFLRAATAAFCWALNSGEGLGVGRR